MRLRLIFLPFAIFLVARCDVFQEQWEGTNARTIIEQIIPHEITKNTFDVVWEGDNGGHPSFVVKAEVIYTDGAGRKTLGCKIVGYTRNDKLGKLLWNRLTGVVPCNALDVTVPAEVSSFAQRNSLGHGRFKPAGLIEAMMHRWFGF